MLSITLFVILINLFSILCMIFLIGYSLPPLAIKTFQRVGAVGRRRGAGRPAAARKMIGVNFFSGESERCRGTPAQLRQGLLCSFLPFLLLQKKKEQSSVN
jgi:hypothetical protein